MSASVNRTYSVPEASARTPSDMAHTLPAQPGGAGRAATTVSSRSRADAGGALSELPAGRCAGFGRGLSGAIAAVVIDDDDAEDAGVFLVQQTCQASREDVGLVPRRDNRRDHRSLP